MLVTAMQGVGPRSKWLALLAPIRCGACLFAIHNLQKGNTGQPRRKGKNVSQGKDRIRLQNRPTCTHCNLGVTDSVSRFLHAQAALPILGPVPQKRLTFEVMVSTLRVGTELRYVCWRASFAEKERATHSAKASTRSSSLPYFGNEPST